jgi:hypothetical protein
METSCEIIKPAKTSVFAPYRQAREPFLRVRGISLKKVYDIKKEMKRPFQYHRE